MNGLLVHEECILRTLVCQKAPLSWSHVEQWKKIKLVLLPVIELRLSESVNRKFHKQKGQSENLFELTNAPHCHLEN